MATRKSAAKSTRGKANKVAATSGKTAAKTAASASGKDARMAIDLDQLETLMKTLERHGITELEIDKGGERLVLRRGAPVAPAAVAVPAYAPAAAAPVAAAAPAAPIADDANVAYVTSPFVGTFYRSPNPTAPVFVDTGAKIKKGQALCIVEAMKLMNEIESDVDGTVVEILVENGKPVEYGDRLFKIKRA